MALPEFVTIERAYSLTPSELYRAIVERNRYLVSNPTLPPQLWNQLLNDIQVLISLLRRQRPDMRIPEWVLQPRKIWLPPILPPQLLRDEFQEAPALFKRVFVTAFPRSVTIESSPFRQLVYDDGYLLLSSLESLMERERFELYLLNAGGLRKSSLAFVRRFVPHYHAWYEALPPDERPSPNRPG